MNDEKVVSLRGEPELPVNLIEIESTGKPFKYCQHERIVLDDHKRVVECRDCGAILDPFDFLLKQADLLRRAWSNHGQAKTKVSELVERIGVLKKEEERLKGRIRRLKEKEPVIDVRGKDRL